MLYMEKETGIRIGNAVGRYARMEEPKNGVYLGSSLKVRVLIDTDSPLRRVAHVRLPGRSRGSCFEVDYLKLPVFCFYCGLLHHDSNNCELYRMG